MVTIATMQDCASEVMFITIQRENIRSSELASELSFSKIKTAWCFQLSYESLRLLIADQ
jgi:hypothetical protein